MSRARRPSGPLGPEDKQNLQQALRSIERAEEMIVKATNCGFDCREHADLTADLRTRIEAIFREFFGGMPS